MTIALSLIMKKGSLIIHTEDNSYNRFGVNVLSVVFLHLFYTVLRE